MTFVNGVLGQAAAGHKATRSSGIRVLFIFKRSPRAPRPPPPAEYFTDAAVPSTLPYTNYIQHPRCALELEKTTS